MFFLPVKLEVSKTAVQKTSKKAFFITLFRVLLLYANAVQMQILLQIPFFTESS
jgi:hypothetical protein